jgi:large subunit ribosomal protein L32e
MMADLLKLRKAIKKKKPEFIRQDAHKKPKLKKKWKRPKGLHSKMRLCIKGYRRSVEKGWGSPREARGLHPSGLKAVLVYAVADLDKIDAKVSGGIISAGVGLKKRVEIAKAAKERGIMILNVKVDKFLAGFEEEMKKRKEMRAKWIAEKEKKKKEKEAKAKEKKEEKLAEKLTEEEKKEKEKEEKEKILTKKEA